MSNLICPFCQQELEEDIVYRGRVFVSCNNPNCIISDWGGCSKQIITKLIHTRKALDIAINVLNRVKDVKYEEYIDEKLEQINEITKGGDNE